MKHISDLFLKYKNTITPPQASVIKEFVLVVEEVSGFKIEQKHCSYKVGSKTIYLKVPSLLKSELTLQKNELLRELRLRLGKNSPKDIL